MNKISLKEQSTLLLIFVLSIMGCPRNGDKPDNGNNGNSEEPLRLLWTHQYNINSFPQIPPITIGDSLVIITGGPSLTCLQIKSGFMKWESFIDDTMPVQGKNILFDDKYIFSTHLQDVRAWDLNSGEEVWKLDLPDDRGGFSYSYHTKDNSRLYLAGSSQIEAIDILDGLDYTVDLRGGTKTVVYGNGRVYCGHYWSESVYPEGTYDYGRITCLDAENGDSLWAFDTDGAGPTYSPLILDEGVLYFGTVRSGQLTNFAFYAIDAESGNKLWQTDSLSTYHAIVEGDFIYGNNGGTVFKLDKHTGALFWEAKDMSAGHGERKVTYLDGYIYHVHGTGLRVINADTGDIEYAMWPDDGTAFRMVGVGSDRVFAQSSAHLYCYEPFDPDVLPQE